MTRSARAFLAGGLLALPVAALLSFLSLWGSSGAWPVMVHLTLFGWITAMITAVNYHTMPVFSGRDFPYPSLLWAHFAIWASGITLATAGLLSGRDAGATVGIALELIAAAIFGANTLLLFLRGPYRVHRPPAPPIAGQPRVDRIGVQATRGAGSALPLALLLLLAVQAGRLNSAWTLAAEHLATLGWLMLMVVGVAYHVLPRFTGYGTRGPAWARTQLSCHLSALIVMVPALGFGWGRLFAAGGLLMTLALGLFAWTIWPTLRAVRARTAATDTVSIPIAQIPLRSPQRYGGGD